MKNLKLIIILLASIKVYSQNSPMALEVENAFKEQTDKVVISNIITKKSSGTNPELKKEVSSFSIYDFNTEVAMNIIEKYPKLISIEIQGDHGETWILELVSAEHSFSDLKIVTSEGKNIDFSQVKSAFYRGIIRGQKNSLVSISLFANEIAGFISFEEGNYVIGKLKTSDEIVLYKDRHLTKEFDVNCHTEHLPLSREE